MSQIVFQKDWFAVFKVKVTVKVNIIKRDFLTLSELLILLQLKGDHHKGDCLVKRLDCSVVVNVKVTEKVQNSDECSSGHYLLSC